MPIHQICQAHSDLERKQLLIEQSKQPTKVSEPFIVQQKRLTIDVSIITSSDVKKFDFFTADSRVRMRINTENTVTTINIIDTALITGDLL